MHKHRDRSKLRYLCLCPLHYDLYGHKQKFTIRTTLAQQLFVQTHADVLGRTVVLPKETESVLLGAAMLAAAAAAAAAAQKDEEVQLQTTKVLFSMPSENVCYSPSREY